MPRTRNVITAEMERSIADRYRSGESILSLSKDLKVLPESVRQALQRQEVEFRSPGRQAPSEVDEVARRLNRGERGVDLVAEEGISADLVAQAMKLKRVIAVDGQGSVVVGENGKPVMLYAVGQPFSAGELPQHVVAQLGEVETWKSLWLETVDEHGLDYVSFCSKAREASGGSAPGLKAKKRRPTVRQLLSRFEKLETKTAVAAYFDVSVRTLGRWMKDAAEEVEAQRDFPNRREALEVLTATRKSGRVSKG